MSEIASSQATGVDGQPVAQTTVVIVDDHAIVREGLEKGYLYLSDADARPENASDPRTNLWDDAADPITFLDEQTSVRRLALDEGRSPQLYAIGIKELWEVPKDRLKPGTVIHTMGWPLDMDTCCCAKRRL